MASILIISPDVVAERMAGPAIRYWEFACALCREHRVTLAIPNEVLPELRASGFALIRHHHGNISELAHQHEIIIFQGHILDMYPQVAGMDKILVADIYDPIPLEGLEQNKLRDLDDAAREIENQVRVMNTQLKWADYFLCASNRQRDLWLGSLMALGRINPITYAQIAQRIIIVPFGLPDTPPTRNGAGLREQLGHDSFILLWGGGIWEWFDPLTVIRAVHGLRTEWPELKLVFLGTRHPNPTVPVMPMQDRAMALADELALTDKHVFFLPGWVPYHQLQNYLLDADVCISAHFATLESYFSFRTRMLYYLWAARPMVATEGDVLADEIARQGAGTAVGPGDVAGWQHALRAMRDPSHYQTCVARMQGLAAQYRWDAVVKSLSALCRNAQRAEDVLCQNDQRRLRGYDCEWEKQQLIRHIAWIENSNSWKLTAYLRAMRRQLARWLALRSGSA